ncbi:MAG: hypothetical protein AB1530_03675 [Candidatus Omnitrophota bacterium]
MRIATGQHKRKSIFVALLSKGIGITKDYGYFCRESNEVENSRLFILRGF